METRLKLLSLAFLCASLALVVKLFIWQIVEGKELSTEARYQHNRGEKILAHRGSVLAKDRTWLAAGVESWLVYASKPEIKESAETIANKLAPLFVESEEENYNEKLLEETLRIQDALSSKDAVWIPIKQKVNSETKEMIENLKINGLGFEKQESRSYPEASAGAQLLGFVGKDDAGADMGYFGLEGFYELTLSGREGFVQREKDATGLPLLFGESKEISAMEGVDLLTHLDKAIQLTVEKRLKEGIERYGASGGWVIVMNPNDGAIMAMASYPSYDPAKYQEFGNEFFKNPNISDSFEPGSIFKPLIMAAALDADLIEPDTKCDICGGPVKVDKYEIETWDKKYNPDSTMTDVLVHSDNVGMTFVGNKLGKEKMFDYLSSYGFGELTGVDLQGEASPALRKRGTWNIVDLATATFGQGIAVTPVQMVKAFSAIANEGMVVTPQVVDKIVKEDWEEDIKPKAGKRVISEEAAIETSQMMVEAVESGEAKWAVPKGFKVAGKTGTAQIPVSGHYDDEKTIASFVGFAPAQDAKFLMLVSLREPTTSPWGSETAAPLWFSIARDIFPYLGIQPEN